MSLDSPALLVRDLRKGYTSPEGGRVDVLSVPSLELAAGKAMAVEGDSGSGKTTLLHVIAGVLPADAGRVEIAGQPMTGLGEAARDRLRAQRIGYLFQTFLLLPHLSAEENVVLGMSFKPDGPVSLRKAAEEALDRVGLLARRHHRPKQLSVGQQQRVAIARALAGRPSLVLADEPTASLDPTNARTCLDLLLEFAEERHAAVLVVSHDPDALGRFERRLRLTPLATAENLA